MQSILDDINREYNVIPISHISFKLASLSDDLYNIINHKKSKKSSPEIHKILLHCQLINNDQDISKLVDSLFRKDEVITITSVDRVFLNLYYRRLLRAKLEQDYIGKELLYGLVITTYSNHEIDTILVEILMTLRVICKFLGISSTTHEEIFSFEKLYMPIFWRSIADKFTKLFGEGRGQEYNSENDKIFQQRQILSILSSIFDIWSGSKLIIVDDKVKIIPAVYIDRLIHKLK